MLKLDLNGKWAFHEVGTSDWLPATVPGCNYTDLMDNGKLADPFKGMNEKDALWVAERDWEYTREFTLTADMLNSPVIMLECDMIDTIADVFVNDKLLGRCENAHRKYTFDVTDVVCKLTNKIRIKFYSPVKEVEKRLETDAMPHNNMGITGVPHLRKPQCHMGWDWGPVLPLSGIMRDIRICAYEKARFDGVKIIQEHADGKVTLNMEYDVIADGVKTAISVNVIAPDGSKIKANVDGNKATAVIDNPELWWPNDISDKERQPLYTVEASLKIGNTEADSLIKRVGLRTIAVNKDKDEWGENFQFIVNGVAVFAKGANWIPADSFVNRFTQDKIEYFLDSIADSNMNMIRVWGGGYYESDAFYDACDERGLLIWQDFAFACAPYPFYNEEFLANVKEEIAYNVKRLRHHACLALWCGNNEIEMMTIGWATMRKLVKWTEKFFHDIMPKELAQYDDVTPFIVGSPTSSHGFLKDVNSDSAGDTHLWHVWHGLQPLTYYRNRFTRFCSEFGLESLCDIKTIEGFAEKKDYSLKSDVFMAHQKCMSGNSKMLYYMATRFRLPERFEDIVYLSQLIQHECVKDATEHWRRNRGRCNGSLYWQLNDCWPVTSWSSIDYEGRYKALQYGAKHFNAPVMVSLEDSKGKVNVYVINDFPEKFEGKAVYRLETFKGDVIDSGEYAVSVDGVSSVNTKELDFTAQTKGKAGRDKVLLVELYDNDDCLVSRKTCMFAPEKKAALKDPKLSVSVKADGNLALVTVKADSYARFVKLDMAGTYKPFSDNYFDMMAGEEATVTFPADGMSEEELNKAVSVTSIATVKPKGGAFSDAIVRMKVALTPINIANYIYYHFV